MTLKALHFMSTFRGRLFVISVSLLAVFVLGIGVYLHQVVSTWTVAVIEEDLQVRAYLMVDALKMADGDVDYTEFLANFRSVDEQRITIVDNQGRLLADTHLSPDEIEAIGSLPDRPEIQAALDGHHGTPPVTRRFSESIDREMLNVALADPARDVVVRVSVPLREVKEVLAGLRALLVVGALIGLGGTLLLSGIASRLMSQILQEVLDRARADEVLSAAPMPLSQLFFSSQDNYSLSRVTQALEETLEELADQRNRFRAVLNGMNEGVLATDDDLQITLSNRTVRQLLGLHSEPEGQSLSGSGSLSVEIVEHLVEHTGESMEFDVLKPTPRRIQVRATRRPEGTGYIFVFHDVTAIRQLESVRRDFVANVSHELRTPVTVIQANAQTLLKGALESPEHARSFTEGIERNARRLARLVAELLDLARFEAGEFDLQIQSLPLAELTGRVIDDVAAYADAESSSITDMVDPSLLVEADSDALRQILINLLENALRYGGDDVQIEVQARQQAEQITFEIVDDGPGVPQEHRERIFERFYRVEEHRPSKAGGTGLGLSIVKHLVEAMGGEVGCRENPEGGAIFWFTLPAGRDIA